MKKIISVLLTIALVFSLIACQNTEEPALTTNTEPTDQKIPEQSTAIATNPVEGGGETQITTEPTEGSSISADYDTDISLDFTMPDWNLNLDIDVVTPVGGTIDVEFPDFEFDFDKMITFRVEDTVTDFTPSDIELNIDADSFDVQMFIEESEDNFSEESLPDLEAMEADVLLQIAQTRANLLTDLSRAFREAELDVQVDEQTGVITLDSAVLFDTNESKISGEGMEFLCNFMLVYTTVVYHERYEDFVSQVVVEGHTDTNGSYQYNLELSQSRADSVKNFCLSEKNGLSAEVLAKLAQELSAVGYSYDNPVYGENGEVDMDASRRVSFRFLISLG